jgi:hypothetical protein
VKKPESFGDLSSLDVYKELSAVAERLEALASRAMSPAGSTALRSAATLIRRLASAFYKASF